ncbi:hypothetical protein [Amycolatopsis japonica]
MTVEIPFEARPFVAHCLRAAVEMATTDAARRERTSLRGEPSIRYASHLLKVMASLAEQRGQLISFDEAAASRYAVVELGTVFAEPNDIGYREVADISRHRVQIADDSPNAPICYDRRYYTTEAARELATALFTAVSSVEGDKP